jgi:hypothetical protein
MLHQLPKLVLVLMVVMILFSPFMQLDSLDKFPVATGDFEFEVICILFETGMFFVFAGLLALLFPGLLRSGFMQPLLTFFKISEDPAAPAATLLCFTPPLRI